ncbi:MAG TPA: hypothetical protein VHM92_06855 [Allosphingosinicella sp.]|nr:hypothetical protein [Allosphingosinicella sp.]
MTQQQPPPYVPGCADAGAQVARLREVLALIDELAGRARRGPQDDMLDDAARLSSAYDHALPIDQKRFDAFASETGRWATAGVQTLLKLDEGGFPVRAAATRLAEELEKALRRLSQRLPG